jgi:hypothetical protein
MKKLLNGLFAAAKAGLALGSSLANKIRKLNEDRKLSTPDESEPAGGNRKKVKRGVTVRPKKWEPCANWMPLRNAVGSRRAHRQSVSWFKRMKYTVQAAQRANA